MKNLPKYVVYGVLIYVVSFVAMMIVALLVWILEALK